MTTKIPGLMLTGALLAPTTLYALGLGEITLNSALNQPFDAEIELIAPTSEELTTLDVSLASADAFARYGVDRPAFLSNFRFRVIRSANGRHVLKVTSPTTVTEPFVTFIVEADWAAGRLLREYTVLLDPPVYMPAGTEAAAPVATPRAGAQSEGVIERPRESTPRPAPQAPAARSAPQALTDGTYTVQRNDTLWRIASRVRPGSARVVNQTMMAIYRANPQAFDGNINLLRSGAVLQIPDAGEIEQISAAEASREVSAQYDAWRGARAGSEGARLRLVAPEESATPTARSAGTSQTAAASAADAELRSRVNQLESELAEARRLLELRNAELAELQRRAAESGAEAAVQPLETPVEPSPSEPLEEPEAQIADTPAAEPEQAIEPAAEPAAQPERPAPAPVAQPPEPSLLERLGDFWWALVVLGLAILAGLLLYFRKRREPDIDDAIETLTPRDFSARRGAPAAGRGRSDSLVVEESEMGTGTSEIAPATANRATIVRGGAAAATGAAAASAAEDTISSETAIAFDQQDALAEADFHMAYGLYDQAADLVKLAIEREPGRRDLKLKLLEIYFVWGNKDMFLETARELEGTRAAAEPGEWDKVLIMGKQICPDEPLFAGAMSGAGGAEIVDLNLEGGENRIDHDLFGSPEGHRGAGGLDLEFDDERETPTRRTDDTGIDFLLDEPQRGGTDFDLPDESTARTQETPTVENPALEGSEDDTSVEEQRGTGTQRLGEQTAELAIDDLGIDVGEFADTDDDENLGLEDAGEESLDTREGTGTVLLDQDSLMSSGTTAEHPQLDSDDAEVDFDLEGFEEDEEAAIDNTAEWTTGAQQVADQDDDVFELNRTGTTRTGPGIGSTRTMESPDLSELEPVTMSEVGTKLDLARAYVDMGDPDGARSILEEVLQEGSAPQQEEAQRLLDSIA